MMGERMNELIKINLRCSKKGQALTELSIFGSMLLLSVAVLIQYALRGNYQQYADMEAFRKAQQIAFNQTGPASAATLVVIKDKPTPDPRDKYGFAERSTIAASASVTWDHNLSAELITSFAQNPTDSDVPRIYFDVDHQSVSAVPVFTSISSTAVPNAIGFPTARYEKRPCPAAITVIYPNPERDTQTYIGLEYLSTTVLRADIRVMRISGGYDNIAADGSIIPEQDLLMFPYYIEPYSGLLRRIQLADVDNDGRIESIVAASRDPANPFMIQDILYQDTGDSVSDRSITTANTVAGAIAIDAERTSVKPGERIYDYATSSWTVLTPQDKQGILADFQKTMQHRGSKIVKTEKPGRIKSQTDLNTQQVISHNIRFKDGSQFNIPATHNNTTTGLYDWK
jgi:hypothetical protein